MRLWENKEYINSKGNTVQTERAVRAKVSEIAGNVNHKVVSRGVRAVNVMRSAELQVLKGKRSGRIYRKPYTKVTYRASAPGEAPARRTGNLRLHWNGNVIPTVTAGGVKVIAQLESGESYAYHLEHGKGKGARPFVGMIVEKAIPEIEKIYREPYT